MSRFENKRDSQRVQQRKAQTQKRLRSENSRDEEQALGKLNTCFLHFVYKISLLIKIIPNSSARIAPKKPCTIAAGTRPIATRTASELIGKYT
jgi:hypothetical protein